MAVSRDLALTHGVVPILATPFDERGGVDIGSIRREVDFLIDGGVTGIAIGIVSEVAELSEDEREQVLGALASAVDGRVPVIGNAGAPNAETAIARGRHAAASGASVLLVTPPPHHTPEQIFEYYAALGDAVDVPIMIQDARNNTGVDLPAEFIARLGREIPNVRYAKVETQPTPEKVRDVCAAAGDDLIVFGGIGGRFTIDEALRGAVGTMPGAASGVLCLVPVWERLDAGDTRGALQRFAPYLVLLQWTSLDPGRFLFMEKELLRRTGAIATNVVRRNGGITLDSLEREEFELLVELIGATGRA
jgi:4-hydroxy-tetrahydrodipicolinate synthase